MGIRSTGRAESRLVQVARGGICAALTAFLLAIPVGAAAQEEFGSGPDVDTSFTDLPTATLLEIMADIDDTLIARGVLPDTIDPAAAYAAHLAIKALELSAAESDFVGQDGVRYRIVAVRRKELDAPLETAPLGDLASRPFDQLIIVVFQRDFQLERAVIAPIASIEAAARDDGAVALNDALWDAQGMDDVTSLLYVAATE